MKLLCVSTYRGTTDHEKETIGAFRPGEVLDVSDSVGAFLLRAAPGCFATDDAAPPAPATEDHPVATAPNRMQKGGRSR